MTKDLNQEDFQTSPEVESACDRLLSPIRTTFEQLVALASMRTDDGARYHHRELAAAFPPVMVERVLLVRHVRTFRQWLQLGLEHQYAQLVEFLASRRGESLPAEIQDPAILIPAAASAPERALFLDDLQLVLKLIDRD